MQKETQEQWLARMRRLHERITVLDLGRVTNEELDRLEAEMIAAQDEAAGRVS